MKNTLCLAGLALAALAGCGTQIKTAGGHYHDYCAACHGDDMTGGTGSSLVDAQWNHGATDEAIARVIRDGLPQMEMPAFGAALSERDILGLVHFIRDRERRSADSAGKNRVGSTIEAETLNPAYSGGFLISQAGPDSGRRHVGYIGMGSYICYDDIDLDGVYSIDFEYAKGPGAFDPGRIAILAYPSGVAEPVNLGEKLTTGTGDWERFEIHKAGLSQALHGPHRLCFWGLEGGGIFNLDKFTLSGEPGVNDGITESFKAPAAASKVLSAAGHAFSMELVAEAPGQLWAMEFLPDGSIVATQKNGSLWLFRDGKRLGPVRGTPKVRDIGQGGLLAVKRHPAYAENGWLYLTYSDPGQQDAATSMTAVVRGRLRGLQWADEQTIYRAPDRFYTDSAAHYGSRLVFKGGYVYFSVGERNHREFAQELGSPLGKIHRLHEDGAVPADNPFTADKSALPSVWSYGHRNPQGLTVDPNGGGIWAAEHGPRGGDEINLVQKGLNYGWPLVTHGINYDGTPISDSPYRKGVEPPKHHWTPSIAVSDIEFYTGERFPRWRGRLLAGSLGSEELHLLRISGDRVTADELLLKGLGRIRDVADGPDGYPYVVLNNPNGRIYRLVPAAAP
jgi:aldose sugar dehydrogenase